MTQRFKRFTIVAATLVCNSADDGDCTLREAVDAVNVGRRGPSSIEYRQRLEP